AQGALVPDPLPDPQLAERPREDLSLRRTARRARRRPRRADPRRLPHRRRVGREAGAALRPRADGAGEPHRRRARREPAPGRGARRPARGAADAARAVLRRLAAAGDRMRVSAAPAGAARILVVDDELGPRESLRMLLKPAYQITTADSRRATLDEESRRRTAKTREREGVARRETTEQSLRVTQLSIVREISRAIVGNLAVDDVMAAVSAQLRAALGYDSVNLTPSEPAARPDDAGCLVVCPIRDAEGPLGYLVADNRASGRPVDPCERELLEMLSEYLAIALRNSHLYGEIADTTRSIAPLIASAGDAIISVDAGDRIDGWNPAAERVFGRAAAEVTGRRITELLPEREYRTARERLARGAAMEVFEPTLTADRETPAALAVTLSGLRNRQGGLDGLIAIARDITAQREVENQLQQSEKLTALGQLAGGIAHDFNNLLQAILGYAQLMKANPTDPALLQRSLAVVESAALDGSETVRRIQQFARLRPDERFMPVDVNQIVQDAVAITRPRWEEKIAHDRRPMDLRLDLRAKQHIHGRSAALTEVMTNLVLNAMDAMPDGGTLSIATKDAADA